MVIVALAAGFAQALLDLLLSVADDPLQAESLFKGFGLLAGREAVEPQQGAGSVGHDHLDLAAHLAPQSAGEFTPQAVPASFFCCVKQQSGTINWAVRGGRIRKKRSIPSPGPR